MRGCPSRARALGFVLVSASVLLLGCPPASTQRSFSTLPSLTTDDPEAEADLREAREAAENGSGENAERLYRRFLERHPDDPLIPLAQLGLGRVLLADGHIEAALERFDVVAASDDIAVAEAGRFYQGVAYHLAGQSAEAVERLEPLVGRTTDPDETALLLRTLSAAAEQTGQTQLALEALDRLARADGQSPTDREGTEARIREVVDGASREAIAESYDALPREGAAWRAVAVRAIRLAFDDGDMARVLEMVADLRARNIAMSDELAELAVRAERTERADPRVIGAIVPLTGPGRDVGQRTVRGLMLASGVPATGPPGPDDPQLVMRDDGGDPLRAAAAVEDLVSEHRAIAIIGPLEGAAARAAATRAQELGVPLITLVPDATVGEAGPMIFRLFASPGEEVSALVRAARARGATRFAILQPAHPYGRAMARAYGEAVRASGGELVAEHTYEPAATAFGDVVQALVETEHDALFIPDSAAKLVLIAPALAAAGLWSTPSGQSAPSGGRAIVVLAPSVGLDAQVARSASRYLQGALFTAPFHDATAGEAGRAFIDAFRARFEASPGTFSAYGYDAFQLIRRGVSSGHTTRGALAEWLRTSGRSATVGASGGTSARRTPAEPPRVLELNGDAFRVWQPPSS